MLTELVVNDSDHFRRTLFPHWHLSSLCLLREELFVPIANLVSNMLREFVIVLPRELLLSADRIRMITAPELMIF